MAQNKGLWNCRRKVVRTDAKEKNEPTTFDLSPSFHCLLWYSHVHILAVSMKTTEAISLKIRKMTVWPMTLKVE